MACEPAPSATPNCPVDLALVPIAVLHACVEVSAPLPMVTDWPLDLESPPMARELLAPVTFWALAPRAMLAAPTALAAPPMAMDSVPVACESAAVELAWKYL